MYWPFLGDFPDGFGYFSADYSTITKAKTDLNFYFLQLNNSFIAVKGFKI